MILGKTAVFLTLGSNLDPERHLPEAVALLKERVMLLRVSQVYRSTPLGPAGEVLDQPPYLNAAALIELAAGTTPLEVKSTLLRPIETDLGRVRRADKYAARPIDIDIALFGDLVLDDPAHRITIPDPEILTRAHVALPLADLAPETIHPVTGETLREIASRFADAPGISPDSLRLTIGD
jgi:2-amino-4-hydroxy-6-hydroxymethyldihydropteridine diphosphokinase